MSGQKNWTLVLQARTKIGWFVQNPRSCPDKITGWDRVRSKIFDHDEIKIVFFTVNLLEMAYIHANRC
jgi:hypothetical protein